MHALLPKHPNCPKHTVSVCVLLAGVPRLAPGSKRCPCFTCEGDVLTEDSRCGEHKGRSNTRETPASVAELAARSLEGECSAEMAIFTTQKAKGLLC